MKVTNTKLADAIKFGLIAGFTTIAFAGVASAQDSNDDAKKDDTTTAKSVGKVTITGSRLKRADVEGATPVTVMTKADLDQTGKTSVADVLRDVPAASAGNFRPQSGSSAQALATVDLGGLGSGRTLVLIDGRRLPKAPFAADSNDVNSIPAAAIERVEILTDGASAVYGSDAIGGVVNVITRKDFNGAEIRYGIGQTRVKGGDTAEFSATFGASGERGNILAGVNSTERGMVYTRDQIGYVQGVSVYGNNYRHVIYSPKKDPVTGALLRDANGRLIPGAFGGYAEGAKAIDGFACNSDGFWKTAAGTCSFDFNSVAANEASIKTKGIYTRGEYNINDNWSAYMSGSVNNVTSFGRYAPVPGLFSVSAGTPNAVGLPAVGTVVMGQAEVNGATVTRPIGVYSNPGEYTAILYNDAGAERARNVYAINGDTDLFHRLAAFGNRDSRTNANVYDANLGFKGRVWDRVDLDFGLRRSSYRYNSTGTGYTVNPLVVAAMELPFDDGGYNARDPFGPARPNVTATISQESFFDVDEMYAISNFDVFEMAGGTSNAVLGAEYRKEDFADVYDQLSEAGLIDGSAGNSSGGSRTVGAAFFEWLFPIAKSLDITLAGRYDKYSDYGADFSPKVAMRWQPFTRMTFRASYGEGFRAPDLSIITQKDTFSAESVNDPATCIAFGGSPARCTGSDGKAPASVQVDTYFRANPTMASEQSKQWSLGFAADPTDWFNMTVDYRNIQINDRIRQFGAQDLIDRTNDPAQGPIPAGLSVTRAADGSIIRIDAGYGNEGDLEAKYIDAVFRTRFDLGPGRLRNQLAIAKILDFTVDGGSDQAGLVGLPDMRATLTNSYNVGDWTFGTSHNFIAGQENVNAKGVVTAHVGGYTLNNIFTTYNTPWNATVQVGVNNVGNRYPQLVAYGGRPWNFYLYDAYGRTVYFRYTQRF